MFYPTRKPAGSGERNKIVHIGWKWKRPFFLQRLSDEWIRPSLQQATRNKLCSLGCRLRKINLAACFCSLCVTAGVNEIYRFDAEEKFSVEFPGKLGYVSVWWNSRMWDWSAVAASWCSPLGSGVSWMPVLKIHFLLSVSKKWHPLVDSIICGWSLQKNLIFANSGTQNKDRTWWRLFRRRVKKIIWCSPVHLLWNPGVFQLSNHKTNPECHFCRSHSLWPNPCYEIRAQSDTCDVWLLNGQNWLKTRHSFPGHKDVLPFRAQHMHCCSIFGLKR